MKATEPAASQHRRSYICVSADDLRTLIENLLRATGCSVENATCAAKVFLEADLRGTSGQGIDYLPYMISNLKKGNIHPRAKPRLVRENASTALIDGERGPGQTAAIMATKLAIRKAKEAGATVVGVRNSTDIFMIGYYADLIATERLAGIVFTSGPPLVHPYGGMDRMLSTNPIAFGFPTDQEVPLICDVSTSAVSGWRLRQAGYYGEKLPAGSGIDRDGVPTDDATAIRQGAISPLGGHKGFALGIAIAAMSGLLTGSQVGAALRGWQADGPIGYFGHTFIAIDPKSLNPETDLPKAVGAYAREIKRSKKAPGHSEIMIPGERAYSARQRHLKSGIPVLDATWEIIAGLAREFDVRMPVTAK